LGDGEGVDDVTDQIDDMSQVEGLKGDEVCCALLLF
jgi:hypothetical protein